MDVIFPDNPAPAWTYDKTPIYNTIIKQSAGRQEYRATFWPSSPCWEISFPFRGMSDDDLRILVGFFAVVRGALHNFYFHDRKPEVTGIKLVQGIYNPAKQVYDPDAALGDGTTTQFQLFRNWNYWYLEYPQFPPFVTGYGEGGENYEGQGYGVPIWETPYIYLNNVLQTTGYTISQSGLVTFDTAPAPGTVLSADFGWYYKCRFKEDTLPHSYTEFSAWDFEKLILRTVD